jgi:hypothetical protein
MGVESMEIHLDEQEDSIVSSAYGTCRKIPLQHMTHGLIVLRKLL